MASISSKLPTRLPASYLREITNNFSEDRVIGGSVFGKVYKGILQAGDVIAVKRLNQNLPMVQGKSSDVEVPNLMTFQHDNILELLGFCHEARKQVVNHNGRYVVVDIMESFLWYEYVPNGTLDKYLNDAVPIPLNWDTRFKIIKGVCQGLHFLQNRMAGPLIHMNIIPSSIWLDDNWVPKIADFDLARIFGKEETQINTRDITGKNQYMAPEYLYRGEISMKSDIYILGMLIIEITTGEKNSRNAEDRSARKFVDRVHKEWATDEKIASKYGLLDATGLQQVKLCIKIGLECVEAEPKKRPSIDGIIRMLNGANVAIFHELVRGLQVESTANVLGTLECMLIDESIEPTKLQLSLLQSITNNFSDDLQIGTGGFAVVYKGQLLNGAVAVKKLHERPDMDEAKYNLEINSLMRVRHKNIVRFLGYCYTSEGEVWNISGKNVMAEERQRFLCFEYLPEGSLDKYIKDASQGLDWTTRYLIIRGICDGLHYLHQQNIVHLDLKPANILLDHDKVPKIADFGLSKCFAENQMQTTTLILVGSPGYMAPESYSRQFTFKSDIYSLGVIIIEILTGQKGYPQMNDVLQSWATRMGTSQGGTLLEHVRVCADIGIQCTQFNRDDRPAIQYIIEKLDELERKYGLVRQNN